MRAARHCLGAGGTGCSMLLIPWCLQGQRPAFEPTSVLDGLGKAKHGGAGGEVSLHGDELVPLPEQGRGCKTSP